jgi:hypothetical protein
MSGVTSDDSDQLLGEVFSGQLLAPGDRGYEETRRVHNGLIDRCPAVIARCLHTADVADAVNFGRNEGLEISVRGGGHGVAGKAVTDGGLMIDLSPMKGIHVDPDARTARAEAGASGGRRKAVGSPPNRKRAKTITKTLSTMTSVWSSAGLRLTGKSRKEATSEPQ